jgi:RNA polymerase sigma-70 factor (ECF subfamily)
MIAVLTEPPRLVDADALLMQRVRDGDAKAFDQLVLRHRRRVVGTISRLMGDRSVAEDLAQQVFFQAYRARTEYEPCAKFSTWLFTITKNVVFNSRRGSMRRRQLLIDSFGKLPKVPTADQQVSAEPNPFDSVLRTELRNNVQEALGRLGSLQRQAIQLVYFQGHCYRSAAAEMGLTENAVRQLLHRGRAKLRQVLKPRLA